MAEACTKCSMKWKKMKNIPFSRLPPYADSLRQHCLHANYLAYLVHHPSLKRHPSPLGHGWEVVGGHSHSICHTWPALPMHLPAPGPAEESEEDESKEDEEEKDDGAQRGVKIHWSPTIQRQNTLILTNHYDMFYTKWFHFIIDSLLYLPSITIIIPKKNTVPFKVMFTTTCKWHAAILNI